MTLFKNIFFVISALAALGSAVAAESGKEAEAMAMMQASFSEVDIKRISQISEKMSLDAKTADRFWPRYQAYLHQQIALRDKQLQTLADFAKAMQNAPISEADAKKLLKASMAQEQQRLANRQKFIKELESTLSPQQQLRLYQIELLLDAQLRARVLTQIPLAEGAPGAGR